MRSIPPALRKKAKKIRVLLLDVDGVLTDGAITMNDRGEEMKSFNVRDGQGIKLLREGGVEVALISARSSKAVTYRARELGIHIVYQGVRNKLEACARMKARKGYKNSEVAYVGDDLMDLPLLRAAGLAITVEDGWEELKSRVDYVTAHKGGQGAVREVAELLLRAQGNWKKVVSEYKL